MICINCGKELTKAQKKYCSIKCQKEYEAKEKLKEWHEGQFDGMKGNSQLSDVIRNYMLEKAGYKCELCGWGEENPYTKKIPLEIHHKDGDYKNNEESNLQVLCPNCHSLTQNYRGANKTGRPDRLLLAPRRDKNICIDCGAKITVGAIRCKKCAGKVSQTEIPITREELKELIRNKPFTEIGRQFGMSDNGVRKWCDKYKLPKKKADINKIPDDEWQEI